MSSHFEEKDVLSHVVSKRAEGMLSVSEAHGTELPGHLSAGADAAREMTLFLLLFWILFSAFSLPPLLPLLAAGSGWFFWKVGRSALLGWARLERLHRLIEQERYEIEHHRPQERAELLSLYEAKGFEGKLLDDVVNVLMADQDRLLKVMLEEEMGLTLQAYEHPLKQCFGAAVGALGAMALLWLGLFFFSRSGLLGAAALLLSASALLSAAYERNRLIPALIWTLSIALLSCGVSYFLFQMVSP